MSTPVVEPLGARAPEVRAALEASDPSAAPVEPGGWLSGSPMDPAAEPVELLPPLPGFPFLHAGCAALIHGPTGGGRSSLVQAGAYDAAREGLRIAYLGSEITEAEFNARAADLAARRGDAIDDQLRSQTGRVRYLCLASTIARANEHQSEWVEGMVALFDVVVVDPLSAVASALGLDFDKSNTDFARFYDRLVQPLIDRGKSAVLLDNIGHSEQATHRAKGASAKGDRAGLVFSCSAPPTAVGLTLTVTKVRSVRAGIQKDDQWFFDRETQRISQGKAKAAGQGETRPAALMESLSRAVEDSPGILKGALRAAVPGRNETKDAPLDALVAAGFVDRRPGTGTSIEHYSIRPFRQAEEGGPRER